MSSKQKKPTSKQSSIRPPGQGLSKSAKRRRKAKGKTEFSLDNDPGLYSSSSRFQVTSVPSALSTRYETRPPVIRSSKNGTRIAHCEKVIVSIAGSTGFTVQSVLSLNPGLASVFPWLAPQAAKYQRYRCHKLTARYVPFSGTGTTGDLMLAPSYEASDPTPTTETQASDNVNSVEDSLWKTVECRMNPGALMGQGTYKFVRPCAVAGDIKTFDMGKLFVITNNAANTNPVGKLFLDYDFEFFQPQNLPDPSTTPQQTSFFQQNSSQTWTSTIPAPIHWDTVTFDALSIGIPASGVFTPPAGCYRVECQGSFSDTSAEAFEVQLELLKNGASFTKQIRSIQSFTTVASGVSSLSLIGVVPCNGTDTIQVEGTLVGVAGTLTSLSGGCQLQVSLA